MSKRLIKITRQDSPQDTPYTESFRVKVSRGDTLISVLRKIQRSPINLEGQAVNPVCFDEYCSEGACGVCTVLVQGRVRLACQALVEEFSDPIELKPLSHFEVLRDLSVDRSRTEKDLQKAQAWQVVDDYKPREDLPVVSKQQELFDDKALNTCIHCDACSEACPQYTGAHPDFVGPYAVLQSQLYKSAPGQSLGSVACRNTQNCLRVCPVEIPVAASLVRRKRSFVKGQFLRWLG